MIEFILFVILGVVVFAKPEGNLRLLGMIVFVVLLILLLVFGVSNMAGWNLSSLGHSR